MMKHTAQNADEPQVLMGFFHGRVEARKKPCGRAGTISRYNKGYKKVKPLATTEVDTPSKIELQEAAMIQ